MVDIQGWKINKENQLEKFAFVIELFNMTLHVAANVTIILWKYIRISAQKIYTYIWIIN